MALSFADVTEIYIPSGEVTKIEDSYGRVLWQKKDPNAPIGIRFCWPLEYDAYSTTLRHFLVPGGGFNCGVQINYIYSDGTEKAASDARVTTTVSGVTITNNNSSMPIVNNPNHVSLSSGTFTGSVASIPGLTVTFTYKAGNKTEADWPAAYL